MIKLVQAILAHIDARAKQSSEYGEYLNKLAVAA